LPLLGARGKIDGPRVLILGGVHGDEPEGISAASAVWQDLDLEQLRGEVLVVPLANLAAWKNGTRESGIDALNLARVFPGSCDGSATQRIAYALTALIAEVDLLVDLHSAGQHYAMPFVIGVMAATR
jgi:predicted deacylase